MTGEAAAIERLRADPFLFFAQVLGISIVTPDQRRVVESVRDNRRTAAPSGHGVGKTMIAAALVLWFLLTRFGAKVITTAPTWFQVETLLWREINRLHAAALVPIGGELTTSQLDLGAEWFAVGLSTDKPTRFQGIHAPAVMLVFDEATGVDAPIWDGGEGNVVGPDDRLLAIGNPTDPSSRFKEVCDSGLWNVVEISSENHPNVLEDRNIIPGAVTKGWCDEMAAKYGRDSNVYRARALGKWPMQGADALISRLEVEAAAATWAEPAGQPLRATGTDVARFGTDETVLVPVYEGGLVGLPQTRLGQDTMATAGMIRALDARRNAVDDTGLGGGVTDRLLEQAFPVSPVNFGENAEDAERFVNRRTELWWNLRELIREKRLVLPPLQVAPRLHADLTNVRYSMDSAGRIKLEPKDQIKKRLGRSPDHGDALALAASAFREYAMPTEIYESIYSPTFGQGVSFR